MENWNEIRTAYQVARLGTVSAAAEVLGFHRVTVIRHIDVLEAVLGEKLFLRTPKGYTPTEAGWELMRVAQATEDQFGQLGARLKARAHLKSGELVIASVPVVGQLLMPAFAAFGAQFPEVTLRHVASSRTLKLERGEAHVAVRIAPGIEEPDNVIQPLTRFTLGLYASPAYVGEMGSPKSAKDLKHHRFVALDDMFQANSAKIYLEALADAAPQARVVFRTTSLDNLDEALFAGLGIGFAPTFKADRLGLTRILPDVSREGRLNLVTHVDLHRTERVQQLLSFLKDHVPSEL